jgi:hypothetical protein
VSDISQHSPLVTEGEVSSGVYDWADIIEVHLPRQAIDDESYPSAGGRIADRFMFIPEDGQDHARDAEDLVTSKSARSSNDADPFAVS